MFIVIGLKLTGMHGPWCLSIRYFELDIVFACRVVVLPNGA